MDSIYIYNNQFINTVTAAIFMTNIEGLFIVNNTFTSAQSGFDAFYYATADGGTVNLTSMNNIFFNHAISGYKIPVEGAGTLSPTFDTADYNLFYDVDITDFNSFIYHDIGANYRYTQWDEIQALGLEVNSPTPAFPHFVDSVSNLRLKSSSPAIGTGTPVSFVTTDYDGNLRDATNPSIGAFEYTGIATSTDIISINIPSQVSSSLSASTHTGLITMPYGTDVTALTATWVLSSGATSSPISGTSQNYSTPLEITVTAEDEVTEQVWTITVAVESLSDATDITSISIPSQVSSSLNSTNHTGSIIMPSGTDVTALIATWGLSSGATSIPLSGVAQNYTTPLNITVTAEDEITDQIWVITVTVQAAPVEGTIYYYEQSGSKYRWSTGEFLGN